MIMLKAPHAVKLNNQDHFIKLDKVIKYRRENNTVLALIMWRDMFSETRRVYSVFQFTPEECNMLENNIELTQKMQSYF